MFALRNICKRFGAVQALEDVSIEFRPGEIHALLGENGAGKSTLMKVLYGMLAADSGEVRVDGAAVRFRRPEDARRAGIGMVHQHFMLVERMTVAENVLLGERESSFWVGRATAESAVRRSAERLGLAVDPGERIEGLSVGERQRVELLKVLRRPVRLLILDEPTAVLTPDEVERLFATLRGLRDGGCGVVFISHKLGEVMRLCERVTVLRGGRTVMRAEVASATAESLAEAMVGNDARLARSNGGERLPAPLGAAALRMECVSTDAGERAPGLREVTLEVKAGEIVGVAGVEGNGQAALVAAALGQARLTGGRVAVRAEPTAYLADDRQREALALGMSVRENAVLRVHRASPYAWHGMLRWGAIDRLARELVREYAIRTASTRAAVATLSGGNQQKLMVARELAARPRLIVAVNPTRGLDISSSALVRARLRRACRDGAGVLLVSTDLDEVLELGDRVAVIYGGRLRASEWPAGGVRAVAALMTGASVR